LYPQRLLGAKITTEVQNLSDSNLRLQKDP
jgi:hypothetical protein